MPMPGGGPFAVKVSYAATAFRRASACALIAFALLANRGSYAAALSPGVAAMIREAAKSGDLDTVVKVAKAANPDSKTEIDALAASLTADAQAEKEAKLARAGIFDAWSGSGQIGFSRSSGNTSDTGIAASIALQKDGLKFRHKLSAAIDRQTSSGVLTRSRYAADYELNYKFSERYYAYGMLGWERDTFAGFTRRFSESAGLGYSVIKTPSMTLDVTAGPALRQTRFVLGTSKRETTGRAALDFSWKVLDNLTLTETASYFLDSQIASTTALTSSLTKALSARLSFDYTREAHPLAGRKPTDTSTKVSAVYGF
jgi:putative salt-induced outer membrane protein